MPNSVRRPSKSRPIEIITDPVASAKIAGLRYVSDARPGIGRRRSGKGFRYVNPDGSTARDAEVLARIRSLVIPPAWTDVWICSLANGHLQATGRDARGRKQSRYHPRWREVRDETKYERMMLFGAALPDIRRRVERDLALPGLPREKVLAAVVRLLETTFIRVGVKGSSLTFDFKGKSGVEHTIDLEDRRLARIVRRCQDLPGYELFQYLDGEGERHSIDATDVNDYLREATQQEFTAKDFRTWAGTVLACSVLREFEPAESDTRAKRNVVAAIKSVAERLGNTPSVCRKCYVHPAVLDHYLSGTMLQALESEVAEEVDKQLHALRQEEFALLQLLAHKAEA
jgi:DNA topoisomerase-1